jgi:chemotaxis protein histidine kinase CheA
LIIVKDDGAGKNRDKILKKAEDRELFPVIR